LDDQIFQIDIGLIPSQSSNNYTCEEDLLTLFRFWPVVVRQNQRLRLDIRCTSDGNFDLELILVVLPTKQCLISPKLSLECLLKRLGSVFSFMHQYCQVFQAPYIESLLRFEGLLA
jgi:hypothetical protein